MKRTFTILPADAHTGLARLVAQRLGLSLDEARRRITDGGVSVAGKRTRDPEHVGIPGQHVVVHAAVASEPLAAPPRSADGTRGSTAPTAPLPIDIRYRDAWIVVADKPAGLPTTATRQSATNALDAMVSALIGVRTVAMHRLDREASGLVLLAPAGARAATRRLAALFAQNRINRRYLALVEGALPRPEGSWRSPVAGKSALTHYRVIQTDADAAWSALELELATGRTHQIRVHAKAAGHALLGDEKFGGPCAARLMLHAYALTFMHPHHAKEMCVTGKLPPWFRGLRGGLSVSIDDRSPSESH